MLFESVSHASNRQKDARVPRSRRIAVEVLLLLFTTVHQDEFETIIDYRFTIVDIIQPKSLV